MLQFFKLYFFCAINFDKKTNFTILFHFSFTFFKDLQNYSMLLGRSKSRRPQLRLDNLIGHLKNGNQVQAQILLQSIAIQPQILEYFKDLHIYTTCENFHILHNYQTLNDGLYILLKGQISYLFQNKDQKRQKASNTKNHCVRDHSIVMNQPLTIFDSFNQNCTAHQESYLLKITPEQEKSTLFQKGRQRRMQLYQNHYLSQDHYKLYNIPSNQRPLNAQIKLHNMFRFHNYSFRQVIILNSPAIISEGRAKLKMTAFNSHEFDQCGLLLPNLKYQVTSSSMTIMIIRKHTSLIFNFNLNQLTTKELPKNRKSKQHRQSASLKLLKKPSIMQQSYKRKKQLAKVTKQIQNYSIVPSLLYTKKFKSSYKLQQMPSKPLKRVVNFVKFINSFNLREQNFTCASAHQSVRLLHLSHTSSLHQAVPQNKYIKCTPFLVKVKASPSEGRLLAKLRKRFQQNQRYKSIFAEILCKQGAGQDYKDCFSSL